MSLDPACVADEGVVVDAASNWPPFAEKAGQLLVKDCVYPRPLGQSAGQRMLHALHSRLAAPAVRAADFMDSDIGVSTIMQAVASGSHETQYTRLFRS